MNDLQRIEEKYGCSEERAREIYKHMLNALKDMPLELELFERIYDQLSITRGRLQFYLELYAADNKKNF